MQTIPFSTECKAGSILNQYRILTYSHSHSHSHSLSYANDMVKQNEGFQKDIWEKDICRGRGENVSKSEERESKLWKRI